MRLLIDGYNLLHQSFSVEKREVNKNALRAARSKLLSLILDSIDESIRARTTIVFDAKEAPTGLPDQYRVHGIQVLFARDWASADELIQEQIQKHPTPRLLTVVSSDHAIHRKATARGATAIDSDRWLDMVEKRRWGQTAISETDQAIEEERDEQISASEKKRWLDEFGFGR